MVYLDLAIIMIIIMIICIIRYFQLSMQSDIRLGKGKKRECRERGRFSAGNLCFSASCGNIDRSEVGGSCQI